MSPATPYGRFNQCAVVMVTFKSRPSLAFGVREERGS